MLFPDTSTILAGLSLCIQGTPMRTGSWFISARFIPVYTGNTLEKFNKDLLKAVYPCVYREHTVAVNACVVSNGLSLCIQGTHFLFI